MTYKSLDLSSAFGILKVKNALSTIKSPLIF